MLTKWQVDEQVAKMANWQNGKWRQWYVDKRTSCQNNNIRFIIWKVDKMAS